MDLTIGTFNLNNLFTRWNFQASVPPGTELTEVVSINANSERRLRRFRGRVVNGKDADDRSEIAERILAMDVDVLAVQEVENMEALNTFNSDDLGGLYPHRLLLEGNDPRLIDVAVLSKLPLGPAVTHQTFPDPLTGNRIFGRDLLQVDVLSPTRSRRLFTLFNAHMKSNFVDRRTHRTPEAQATAARSANDRRRRQSIATAEIIEKATRPNSRYVFLGDMNDDPDSLHLAPVVASPALGMVDALIGVQTTRPPKIETSGPPALDDRWTSRHRADGITEFRLFDQIWVSPALASRVQDPTIDRRTKHGGDGSDHDPAWITLTSL